MGKGIISRLNDYETVKIDLGGVILVVKKVCMLSHTKEWKGFLGGYEEKTVKTDEFLILEDIILK